jgi:hypothetical protein
MPKLTLNTIGSRYGSIDALNDNFDAIEDAFDNTLSLDGTSPNEMQANLNMGGNRIINTATAINNTDAPNLAQVNSIISNASTGLIAQQREKQTATNGQTVVTLTGLTYFPNSNNLSVYVNGVKYYVGDAYVESSSTTVTFVEPLVEGDRLEFVTNEAVANQVGSSENISYLPAGTGAVATNVQSKLRESVSVLDFGADPTGVVDSTSAIQNAINSFGASGGVVVVPCGLYIVTAKISMRSLVTVRCEADAVINLEGLATGIAVEFLGSVGSTFTFAQTRTRGDTTVAISGSPNFSVGDTIHLVSNTSVFAAGTYNLGFHPTDNCYYAEWNIIAADLGGGVYKLAIPFEFPGWTTAATAKKVTPIYNSSWIGGKFIRRTSGTVANAVVESRWAYRCVVDGAEFDQGSRAGMAVQFRSSWKCEGRSLRSDNDPSFPYDYALHHGDYNRFKTRGTQDCGFTGLKGSYGGQIVDFTYSSGGDPFSNIRSYCNFGQFNRCFEGLTSHPGCYQEQWVGNIMTDCYDDGLVVRGYLPVIQGNTFVSTQDITDSLTATAGSFIIGRRYTITTVGTTDFTLIGASANTIGVRFVATGAGSGTGTATQVETYGIRLGYGGARRADITGNVIRGFYGAFNIYGSPSLGEWGNVLCNIHDNEVAQCFVGLDTSNMGNTNTTRFITYQNNRHSAMGRYVVYFPGYAAASTIKGNVLDGGFRYTGAGADVAFVEAAANCPALHITGNQWMRTKGTNASYTKYMVRVGSVSDTTTFPVDDWGAQTVVTNNIASFDAIDSVVMQSIASTASYRQETFVEGRMSSTIASGVATCVMSANRRLLLTVDTEGSASIDDLDRVTPSTNFAFLEGDLLILKTTANARDVVVRDVATSGAATFGFQTPANASITLGTSNDTLLCVFSSPHWRVVSQSLNG